MLPLLYIAQDEYGHLTDAAIREVAEILESAAHRCVRGGGFYTLFYNKPVGKWVLQVATMCRAAFWAPSRSSTDLEATLGIKADQTTADGMFTLQRVKCLADCDRAPLLQANLDYYRNLTPEKVDSLLTELRQRADAGQPLSISGRLAER